MTIANVGFIGLGNIGRPIASNLARAGFRLQVIDLDPAAVTELVGQGAVQATTPAAMARSCEVVCLCVRDDDQVEALLNGVDGLLAGAEPGLHLLIHSTVSARAFRRWQPLAAARGVVLVDANVSGGAGAVAIQRLCYMVGADDTTLEYIRPVLAPSSCNGGAVVHAGPAGAGLVLKLANNAMAFFAFAAIHEAAKMVEAGGGSLEKLLEVGATNGVITEQMKTFIDNRVAMTQQYGEEGFRQRFAGMAKLVEKDMRYAVTSADELGVEIPCSRHVHGFIERVFLNAC